MEQPPPTEDGSEEIPQEERAESKSSSRLNALIMGLVFLLLAVAPYPWKAYAPLLFLIPVIYGIIQKRRQSTGEQPQPYGETTQPDKSAGIGADRPAHPEPYSYTPKDPKDPRRYKPIG